ncbi:hypothetical protein K435DRAFT_590386, partial [Dendrothele bispora CBS 962.96]
LLQLLDLTLLSDSDSISRRFNDIADLLLRKFELVVKSYHENQRETCYKILELEFYLWKTGCHEDPFTHGSEEQRLSGQWYFHRVPRNTNNSNRNTTHSTGYRGGSRKGLDLTFGGPVSVATSPYFQEDSLNQETSANSLRGGILLRSIQRVKDGKVISGPSLLVDELLAASKASSITKLVENHWKGDISCFRQHATMNGSDSDSSSSSTFSSLTVRPCESQQSDSDSSVELPVVYRSPRIGLDLSNQKITLSTPPHPRVIFVSKTYRYFIYPTLLTANGRHQTFLGALYSISSGPKPVIRVDDQTKTRISSITGIRDGTVQVYLDHFVSGYGDPENDVAPASLSSFIGSAGKGVSSNPARYLKMMGCL